MPTSMVSLEPLASWIPELGQSLIDLQEVVKLCAYRRGSIYMHEGFVLKLLCASFAC